MVPATTSLILIFLVPIGVRPDVIQPFNHSTGIFFDGLGKLKVVNGQLNVINYIDISYMQSHLVNLKETLNTITFTCKQSLLQQCLETLSPLVVRYEELVKEYESISHLISKRNKRSAWFGAVGTMFKHIFGTLDEDDAIKYDSAINELQNDEKTIAQLVKENILVTNSSLEKFKYSITNLNENEKRLNDKIKDLLNITNRIHSTTESIKLNSKVLSILTYLESALMTLSFQLEDLTDAVILTKQNILHPTVITPTQLFNELINNDRYLPKNSKISTVMSIDKIHLILSISDVACYYFRNKLVFVLQIPLVLNDDFNLYHSLALPTPHGSDKPNVFSMIQPHNKYIAISYDKVNYCILDSLELCKTVNSELFLCKISMIILTNNNPTCESELLTKTTSDVPKQCKTKTIKGDVNIWQPLKNNRWLYVQSVPSKIHLDCITTGTSELKVFGIGILNIPEKCIVYTKSAKLITSDIISNITVLIPKLDFSIINNPCCKIDKSENYTSFEEVNISNLDELKFDKRNNKIISELDKVINKEPVLIKYEKHYLIFNGIFIVIVIIVIVIIFFKIYNVVFNIPSFKKFNRTKKTSTDNEIELDDINIESKKDLDNLTKEPELKCFR